MQNKEIRLASRPAGMPTLDNFNTVDTVVPQPKDGEVLVRTLYISVDPYLRGRMREGRSYAKHGSLFVTRPSLQHYVATRAELDQRSGEVLQMIANDDLKLRIYKTYPLAEAQQAHRDLEGRKTTGKLLLIP